MLLEDDMEDKKLASRKLWAFILWSVLVLVNIIVKFELSEKMITSYALVTILYLSGQSVVDVVKAWKKKDE